MNRIITEDNDKKEEYRILFKVETLKDNASYVIYTNDEKSSDGEIITYAANYTKKNGKQILEPIKDDYVLEILDSVLLQIESKTHKSLGD